MYATGVIDPATTEEMVLGLLADAGDALVPGEVLCGKLGLGPPEVYRHIQGLRAKGYRIDALGRRGYRLVSIPDRLGPLELGTLLTTHDVGRSIHHRRSVPSTNDVAFRLAREGALHGDTVIAEHQSRGRGRRGRTWVSPEGRNLYCSIVLRPDLPASRAPEATFVAAVALARTVREAFGLPAAIKWPNDVRIEGRKVAGILTELDAAAGRVRFIVLGLGVNINLTADELPAEVRPLATSLREALGQSVDRALFTSALFARLEDEYDRWVEGGFGPVREAWCALSDTLGQRVRVTGGPGEAPLEGEAVDVDADGALRVRRDDGTVERVLAGDVESLRDA